MTKNPLLVGIAAALGAGLLWGLVFVTPLLLTLGRYLALAQRSALVEG